MSGLLAAVDRYWYAPAPASRLASLRLMIGAFAVVYLVIRAPGLASFAKFRPEQFEPVGPVVALASPLPTVAVSVLLFLCLALGIAFTAGWRFRFTGPAFAIALLWVLSYRNSWGMIFHTENLLVIHVLALGLSPAADTLAFDARASAEPESDGRYGWPVRVMCLVVVIVYVIAGLSKLRNAGFDWVTSDILRNYVAYDNLRKVALGDVHSPVGALLVRHGWLFPPLAGASLVLELGAPVALLSRKAAAVWAVSMWGFHVGVLAIMAILFPYQLTAVGFAPLFRAERLVFWVRDRVRRGTGPTPRG